MGRVTNSVAKSCTNACCNARTGRDLERHRRLATAEFIKEKTEGDPDVDPGEMASRALLAVLLCLDLSGLQRKFVSLGVGTCWHA